MKWTYLERAPQVGRLLSFGVLASFLFGTLVSGQTQPGLLQEWVRAPNPGNQDAIIDLIENEGLIVPPFHSSDGTSWWTGNQAPGWNVPQYPSAVVRSLGSSSNNENYVVRSTGEIFIPESGTYRFADGNDDYTHWAIDANKNGIAGDGFGEVIIDDNAWTNLQRAENNGGQGLGEIDLDVVQGGEWLAVEFLMGEGTGTDAGVIYWDYAVGRGGLGAADGFPQFPEEPVDLVLAEAMLVPDSHLRAPAGPAVGGPATYVAGWQRIGENSLRGTSTNEVVGPGGGILPGLRQEWVNQPNPGTREGIIELIENNELLAPPFHSSDGTSWWTGNQSPGWNVPQYPAEVVDQIDNPSDSTNYVVRATGEILIPQSGTYRFADGNDDYTYWAVDADKSGIAGDVAGEVIIDDNAWTNLQRDANNGGQGLGEIEIVVQPGGQWLAVEFLMGEGTGTDAGVIYWDYGADGGGLNAADGFPEVPEDPIDLFEAETWLIPDSHLRAPGGADLVSADLLANLDKDQAYEFDVDGSSKTNDKFVMANRDPNVYTTIANVDGVTLRINPVGPVSIGDSFDVIDADQIRGTPIIVSTDPTQTWAFNNATGEVTLGVFAPKLQAGDADQDLDFDQVDIVKVQIAGKYLTGQTATWGEGDWNGAPGGSPGNPPPGNTRFDQLDIVAALTGGVYLKGPYAALRPGGIEGDRQTSLKYNANTGELAVDAPAGIQLTSVNIDSAAGIFTGAAAQNLGGSFDNDSDTNIFKATFGSSFGSLSFGNVAQPGLAENFLLSDLSVVGSLAGGGALGNVDLIYVPEPSAIVLVFLGALAVLARRPLRVRIRSNRV